jgi:hypothetical protein
MPENGSEVKHFLSPFLRRTTRRFLVDFGADQALATAYSRIKCHRPRCQTATLEIEGQPTS